MICKEVADMVCLSEGRFSHLFKEQAGIWKVIGGMNKNHPTKDEIEEAVRFYGALVQNMIE